MSLIAALTVIAAGMVAILVEAPASASVSKFHGKLVSQVSGCSTNYRIGKTARLCTPGGTDFGWVEWRASRTKKCAGYQWIRMHLKRNIGFVSDEETKWLYVFYKNGSGKAVRSYWYPNHSRYGTPYLKTGTYNSRIFYAPSRKACAWMSNFAFAANPESPYNELRIVGQGSTGKPAYCA